MRVTSSREPALFLEIARSTVFPRCALAAVLAAIAAGCGPDGPPPYYYPAGPCASDLECPFGSYCVDPGPVCLGPCRSSLDCVPGNACESKKRHGTAGKISVCNPK